MLFFAASLALADEHNPFEFNYRINARPEFQSNNDFDGSTDDTTGFYRQNIRLISTGTWDGMIVRASFQDVRTWGTETVQPASADLLVGLHEGYFQLGTQDNSQFWVRVGRQAYNFGKANILGPANWNIYGLAHDGIRVHYQQDTFSLDILGVQQSNFRRFDSVCSLDDCTDFESETITTNGDQLYFIHGKGNIAKGIQVQPFTLIRIQNPTEANQNRERRVYSPGVLFFGNLSESFQFLLEGVYQFGQSTEDIEHQAWKGVVEFDFVTGPLGIKLHFEENSGDGDATDDVDNNFEAFFPNNHGYRGWADKIGGINSQDTFLELRYRLNDQFKLKAQAHHFALSNPTGSWYSFNGSRIIGTPDSNNTTTGIGEEIDVSLEWSPRKGESIRLTHAHFIPTGVGKEITAGDPSYMTYVWFLINK